MISYFLFHIKVTQITEKEQAGIGSQRTNSGFVLYYIGAFDSP